MRKPTRNRQPNVNRQRAEKRQPVVNRLATSTMSLQTTHSVLLKRDPSKGWGSELGVAVPVTPGSAPCPDGFVVQLSRQQDVVKQPQYADAG